MNKLLNYKSCPKKTGADAKYLLKCLRLCDKRLRSFISGICAVMYIIVLKKSDLIMTAQLHYGVSRLHID